MDDREERSLRNELMALRDDLTALRHFLTSFMHMFLEESPEGTYIPRFRLICEEAEARCPDEQTRVALRRIVKWEGDDIGWRK